MVTSARTLCAAYRQPCSSFTGQAFNQQYPVFRLPSAWDVVYHPGSGFVRPDATRAFLHRLATAAHATVRHDAGKAQIDLSPTGVRVHVAGETLTGDLLIVSVGSWLPKILPNLPLAFRAERRVMAWYRPETPFGRTAGELPIFILDADGVWYGMPTPDGMIKIGNHKHFSEPIDPDQPTKDPDGADLQRLAPCAQNYFTGLSKMPVALKQCIYTLTDDHHFVIDRHPQHPHVLIFSCCSGHGFKYAPEYGAIAADLVSGKPRSDLAPFSLKRTGPATVRFNT
jgi:sarcosine oxidase